MVCCFPWKETSNILKSTESPLYPGDWRGNFSPKGFYSWWPLPNANTFLFSRYFCLQELSLKFLINWTVDKCGNMTCDCYTLMQQFLVYTYRWKPVLKTGINTINRHCIIMPLDFWNACESKMAWTYKEKSILSTQPKCEQKQCNNFFASSCANQIRHLDGKNSHH